MNREQADTLLTQIGRMNVAAISGGRSRLDFDADGNTVLVLPVSNGYSVQIAYNEGADDYTVRRVFKRGPKTWIKGEVAHVYAWEVGEVAYQAHAFRSYEFGQEVSA